VSSLSRRLLAVATATLLGAPLLAVAPAQAADPVTINLIGINDFHGRIDANTVKFAGTVEKIRQEGGSDKSLLISAGDNVSASLFASATQGDIPTIDVLNAIGLDASAAGNHEFDKGADDLVGRLSDAADFPFLAANVFRNGAPLLDTSATFDVSGVKVAVVGAVTEETLALVSPGGMAGVTITDPTDAINDTVAELEALPAAEKPDVIVASIHEGAPDGTQTYDYEVAHSAVFKEIAEQTSPDVDAIFMGHTHQTYTYDAPIPGRPGKTRPLIQTGNYGANVGNIKLTVDPDTGEVASYTQKNVARTTDSDDALVAAYPDVKNVQTITNAALAFADQKGKEVVGEVTADITTAFTGTTRDDRASESTLGNLVADALVAKVKESPAGDGATIGVVNPGGLRDELRFAGAGGTNVDGAITYAEANAVLPFVNQLNAVNLTGASFKKALEQQWQRDAAGNVPSRSYLQLGLSKNVRYTFDPTLPEGSRITSVTVDGQPLDLAKTYKIATFSFLATGGDNFRAFTEGTTADTGLVDYEAWIDYLGEASPVSPDFARRSVQTTGVKSSYGVGSAVSFTLGKLDLTSLGSPANTSVSSKLLYGDGQTRSLGSRSVAGGTSAPIAFTLPAGASGAMTVESTVYPSGTKVTVPLDVTGASVSAPSLSATFGDEVPVAVSVTGPVGTPSGTIVLKKGDTEVGTGTLAAGTTTIPVDTEDLGAGVNALTIAYAGDGSYKATTGTVTVTVAQAGTTTSAPDPAPTKVSDDAAVDVTVESANGTTPTGQVTVSEGGTELGSATLEGGKATVDAELAGLTIGQHELTVAYAGDANHVASTTTVTIGVLKGTSGLTASSGGAPYGTSSVVQVTGQPGATGLVYVSNGATVVGVGFLVNGTGSVALSGTALTPGSYTLGVFYGGSDSFDPSSTSVGVTVTKASTTLKKVSVSPSKIVVKRTRPFVTLSVTGNGFTVDGGTVTLRQSGKSHSGTVKDGKVRIRLAKFTSSGSKKKIVATYSGNGVADGSSTSFTVKVLKK